MAADLTIKTDSGSVSYDARAREWTGPLHLRMVAEKAQYEVDRGPYRPNRLQAYADEILLRLGGIGEVVKAPDFSEDHDPDVMY